MIELKILDGNVYYEVEDKNYILQVGFEYYSGSYFVAKKAKDKDYKEDTISFINIMNNVEDSNLNLKKSKLKKFKNTLIQMKKLGIPYNEIKKTFDRNA